MAIISWKFIVRYWGQSVSCKFEMLASTIFLRKEMVVANDKNSRVILSQDFLS